MLHHSLAGRFPKPMDGSYVADSPGYRTFFACSRLLVCLTFDAWCPISDLLEEARHRTPTKVHDVIAAYSTVIHYDVPCPQGYCIPLFKISHLVR